MSRPPARALLDALARHGALDLLGRMGILPLVTVLWRLGRRPQTWREERDLLRDYREFRAAHGPTLGPGADLADPRRKVLVVSLTDWVMQIKGEAMLAKALQLRGLTPVIAIDPLAVRARLYFRGFGFRDFVSFERFGTRADENEVRAEAAAWMAGSRSFRDLRELQYRGVHVGRHVLGTVSRMLRQGTPDLADPRVRAMLERLLPAAMRTVRRTERLVATARPEMALFLERGYTPYGEVYDVLLNAGVNVVQWVGSHVNESLVFRRCTPENRHDHPFSLSDETWDEVRRHRLTEMEDAILRREFGDRYRDGAWFNRQRLQDGKRVKAADEIRRQLGLDPEKKTAVVFSHLLWDATFFFGTDVFDNYEQWLVETVRAACRNPRLNWVVKLHPANVWKVRREDPNAEFVEERVLREQIGPLPPHVKLVRPETDINTYSFFQLMDYCLTVRGTIGMEAPCYGIPVVTAGTGRYSGRGFTLDSRDREEYLARLARLETVPPLAPAEIELAKKHAYALFKLRPLEFTSFRLRFPDVETPSHPLDHNADVLVRSFAELAAAPDLKAFADWAIHSKRPDFVNGLGE